MEIRIVDSLSLSGGSECLFGIKMLMFPTPPAPVSCCLQCTYGTTKTLLPLSCLLELVQVAPTRVDFPGVGRHLVVKLAAGERHASALTLGCTPPPRGWDKDKQWEKVAERYALNDTHVPTCRGGWVARQQDTLLIFIAFFVHPWCLWWRRCRYKGLTCPIMRTYRVDKNKTVDSSSLRCAFHEQARACFVDHG